MTDSATTPNAPTAEEPILSDDEIEREADSRGFSDMDDYGAYFNRAKGYRDGLLASRAALLAARRDGRALRDAAKDCADDLEAELRNRYGYPDIHPAMQGKYERDVEPVLAVRAALAAPQEGKTNG